MHIVIINTLYGTVESTNVFDTNKSSEKFDSFINKQDIPDNFIIVAACKDECA